MAACLYSLATNPDVQERLREEVRRVVGEEKVVTPQHVQDMHYLRDTIKETMRYVQYTKRVFLTLTIPRLDAQLLNATGNQDAIYSGPSLIVASSIRTLANPNRHIKDIHCNFGVC